MALFIVVPLIYSGRVYDGALLPKMLVFQALAALLFGICLRNALRDARVRPASPVLLPLFCYLLLTVLSAVQSANRIEATLQLAHYVVLALVPFLVICTLSPERLLRVLHVAAWTGLPVSLIGLAQYFGWNAEIFGWGVYDIPSNANPSATFFHRNASAEYLIGVLPLAWIGFRLARTPKIAAAYAGLLVLLGAYLIYTRTRGAWVGLAGAIVATAVLAYLTRQAGAAPMPHARLKRMLLVGAVLSVALGALLPEDIKKTGSQRFDEKKTDPLTTAASIVSKGGHRGRLDLWRHTWDIIRDRPLLGVGPGNWQYAYPAYARGEQVNVTASPSRPHNDFLWIASETGLLGLLAYLAVLACIGRFSWDLLKAADPASRTAVLGLSVLALAHLGDGMFNFPRERVAPALCFWFALGGIALLHRDRFSNVAERRVHSRRFPIAATGLGCLLLIASLCIGYRRLRYDIHHLQVFYGERRGDWATVMAEAERAGVYGPLRTNTFIALGRARYRTGSLTGAETAYLTALRIHPNSLNAYNNLGIVYRQTGQLESAADAFRSALKLCPGFPEACNNLGNVYRDQGRLNDAIGAYRQAVGLPVPQIHYNLGRAYLLQGNPLRAQENYLLALKIDPRYLPARRALIRLGVSPAALPSEESRQDSSDASR